MAKAAPLLTVSDVARVLRIDDIDAREVITALEHVDLGPLDVRVSAEIFAAFLSDRARRPGAAARQVARRSPPVHSEPVVKTPLRLKLERHLDERVRGLRRKFPHSRLDLPPELRMGPRG